METLSLYLIRIIFIINLKQIWNIGLLHQLLGPQYFFNWSANLFSENVLKIYFRIKFLFF
jgi:hypothetical protein